MANQATATFELKSWDERPFAERDGVPKLTRVSAIKSYQGDLSGEGQLEYLMMYRDDGSATFTGLERVVGKLSNRSGTLVLQHSGTFESGIATVSLSIVSGSGTEDWRGITGEGNFAVGHQQPYTMSFE